MGLLIAGDPYKAFARAARAFYPAARVVPRRAASAIIDPTATVPADCDIGEHVVIEAGVRLRTRVQIGPQTVIPPRGGLRDECVVGAQVAPRQCLLWARVVVHPRGPVRQP